MTETLLDEVYRLLKGSNCRYLYRVIFLCVSSARMKMRALASECGCQHQDADFFGVSGEAFAFFLLYFQIAYLMDQQRYYVHVC